MKVSTKILLLVLVVNLLSCGNKVPLKLPDSSLVDSVSYETN